MKYKFSLFRTLATIFIVVILVSPILIGSGAEMFFNIPSFVVTFGLCFFMSLAVYEVEFLKFIPHALGISFFKPLEPNHRFAQIALFGSRSIIGAGIIGMIIGLIQILSNLADPSGIGIGMATALTCPFYTIVGSELCFAIVYQSFKDAKVKKEDNPTLPLKNVSIFSVVMLFSIFVFCILVFNVICSWPSDLTPSIQTINKFRKDCPQAAYWLDYDMKHIVNIQSDIAPWSSNNGTIHFESTPEAYKINEIIQYADSNGWKYHLSVNLTQEHIDDYDDGYYGDGFVPEEYNATQIIDTLRHVLVFPKKDVTILAFETGNYQGWASYIIIAKDLSEMIVFFNNPQHPDAPHDFWVPEGFIELNKMQSEKQKEIQ